MVNNLAHDETAVQHGQGWTGILVLKGSYDISPLYRQALSQTSDNSSYSLVYGDAQHGNMEFRDVTTETPVSESMAHIAQKFPIRPFSLLLMGDSPATMHVPARSTTVALWNQGHCSHGFNRMIEMLVQLNREPQVEKSNYARLVRERVFEPQTGKYAVCMGYFSRHPRIILATRSMEIYSWIVCYNNVYSYVWSTNRYYMDSIKEGLDTVKQNELFYMEIGLENRSLLVIHPLFWITKFNKVMNAFNGGGSKLLITSWMRNYVLRMAIQRPEYLEVDGSISDGHGAAALAVEELDHAG